MVSELQKQEQSPDVQAQINELNSEVERRKKAAEAMQAGKQKNVAKDEKKVSPYKTYEEWELLRSSTAYDAPLSRHRKIKDTRLTPGQAAELNAQMRNTLFEYVLKSE